MSAIKRKWSMSSAVKVNSRLQSTISQLFIAKKAIENNDIPTFTVLMKSLEPDLPLPNTGAKHRFMVHYAAEKGRLEMLQILRFHGANMEIQTTANGGIGFTPLHVACRNGNIRVARYLLRLEPPLDINRADDLGNTPLHCACLANDNQLDLVRLLLSAGANPNAISINAGYTPLMSAFNTRLLYQNANLSDMLELTKTFLQYDCDLKIFNNNGCNLLDVAAKNRLSSVCLILLRSGLNWNVQQTHIFYGVICLNEPVFKVMMLSVDLQDVAIKRVGLINILKSRFDLTDEIKFRRLLICLNAGLQLFPSKYVMELFLAEVSCPLRLRKPLLDFYSNPHSLKFHCRCSLRRLLGQNYYRTICKLTSEVVPSELIDYLNMNKPI